MTLIRGLTFSVLLPMMVILATTLSARLVRADEKSSVAIKDGQSVAFVGDSITAQGAETPGGFVNLVISGLMANGIKASPVCTGVYGNTSQNILVRLDRDVLSKKPNWLVLSCGVNDVRHVPGAVPLEQYKVNMTKIVEQAQAAGVNVLILTATMIGEDQKVDFNQKLIPYNEFLRSLAKDKKCLLADLNAAMQDQIATTPHTGRLLTVDGVHMNFAGNLMMATGIMKALGLGPVEMKKVEDLHAVAR